ncbi:MAG: hypothetical protein CMD35_08395, partial [Flavobacteriales bacterium]|nr:hypothetical protein [Flavobacteriales bacterium]
LEDIPEHYPLSDSQQIQVLTEKSGERIIDRPEVSVFLSKLAYPIAHLDFETMNEAIPKFKGTRPYQQVCFQWSAHLQNAKNGEIEHKEYLGLQGKDPRENFILTLIDAMKGVKTILVYNIGFERGRLSELLEQYSQYSAQLSSIIDRMYDLMLPFSQKTVYFPEMRGSYSIKKVLPALVPELNYNTLNIQEGGTASSTYANLHKEGDQKKIEQTRKDLLAYCEMDTWAMVKILEKLYELAN